MSNNILKVIAGVGALAAIAFGASAIAGASGSSNSTSAPGRMAGPPGGMPRGGPGPGGFGRPVTGAAASKVKAAVLAKYPGTIERIMALPNGGYVAHVFRTGGGEVHVLVDSNFQVSGVDAGPPGGGPPPPAGAPHRPGTSS